MSEMTDNLCSCFCTIKVKSGVVEHLRQVIYFITELSKKEVISTEDLGYAHMYLGTGSYALTDACFDWHLNKQDNSSEISLNFCSDGAFTNAQAIKLVISILNACNYVNRTSDIELESIVVYYVEEMLSLAGKYMYNARFGSLVDKESNYLDLDEYRERDNLDIDAAIDATITKGYKVSTIKNVPHLYVKFLMNGVYWRLIPCGFLKCDKCVLKGETLLCKLPMFDNLPACDNCYYERVFDNN